MIVKSLSFLGVILALSVEPTSAITGKFFFILKFWNFDSTKFINYLHRQDYTLLGLL